jgi:hypothetical protein
MKGGTYRKKPNQTHPTTGAFSPGLRYGNVTTQATAMWQIRKPRSFAGLCFL